MKRAFFVGDEEDSLLCLAALSAKNGWYKKKLKSIALASRFFTGHVPKKSAEAVEEWIDARTEKVVTKMFCSKCKEEQHTARAACENRSCELYK